MANFSRHTMTLLLTACLATGVCLAQDDCDENCDSDTDNMDLTWDPFGSNTRPGLWYPIEEEPTPTPQPKVSAAPVVSVSVLKAPKKAVKLYEQARRELARNGDREVARKHLEESLKVYPEFSLAWHALGLVHLDQDRRGEAKIALKQAIWTDPKYWRPYHVLAEMAAAEQKWPEAAAICVQSFRVLTPPVLPLRLTYAEASLWLGNMSEAIRNARLVMEMDIHNELPKAQYILGLALFSKGDLTAAFEELDQFAHKTPDPADRDTVHRQIAFLQEQTGGTQQPDRVGGPSKR